MAEGAGPTKPDGAETKAGRSKISLETSERNVHLETAIQIAVDEHRMRRELANGILRIFVIGNLGLWVLVAVLVAIDVFMTTNGYQTNADRIIDRGVVKTIVGATTIQVGIIMVAITKNLFPRTEDKNKSWWKLW